MAIDGNQERSPFTRPGFIVAAVVVALIVVAGIVVAIVSATRGSSDADPAPQASASPSVVASPEPSAVAGDGSVCGLSGEKLSGTVSRAPEARWEYQGTTAYPVSEKAGPASTSPEGVRYCFQHSPEGAVLAATNAVVQGSSADTLAAWLDYFVSEGPNREAVLSQDSGVSDAGSGTRIEIAGFRVLAYDGSSATVDVAVRGSSEGQTVNLSMVYTLVWQDGDWKLNVSDPNAPIDVANVPDLSGYVSWGE